MNIEELRKEYATQDNRMTAYPIYVMVQELVCIGVMAEGYSVNCPYGDGETKTEYRHEEDCESTFSSKNDLMEHLKEEGCEDKYDDFEQIEVGYIWHPVEFFLTVKGAKEYMKANAHNHGKLRTYVGHFERRNFEMRGLLEEIDFRVKD